MRNLLSATFFRFLLTIFLSKERLCFLSQKASTFKYRVLSFSWSSLLLIGGGSLSMLCFTCPVAGGSLKCSLKSAAMFPVTGPSFRLAFPTLILRLLLKTESLLPWFSLVLGRIWSLLWLGSVVCFEPGLSWLIERCLSCYLPPSP